MPRRLLLLASLAALVALAIAAAASGQTASAPVAGGYDIERAAVPAACSLSLAPNAYFGQGDCGTGTVTISGAAATASLTATFLSASGSMLGTADATHGSGEQWSFDIAPEDDWPAGPITIRMKVSGETADGDGTFFLNTLGAELEPAEHAGGYRPGDAIPVTGKVFEQQGNATGGTDQRGVPATFKLRVVDAAGHAGAAFGPFTAGSDGSVDETVPGSATAGIHPDRTTDWKETVRLELVDASYTDATSGDWAAPDGTSAGSVQVSEPPDELVLQNSFVSSKGWVKPGDTYPFTLKLENFTASAKTGAVVTVPAPDGTSFGSGNPATLTWNAGSVPAAGADGSPGVKTLVAEAKADTLAQDAQIVWKDLSTTAQLNYDGGPSGITRASHGPKVIPPTGGYDTARYGDRPFPVVPVDYADRSHEETNSAAKLAGKINDPENPGSTRNLYQEMSYGQLFPNGTVPSDGVASADWTYSKGFDFTKNTPKPDTCHGVTGATLGDSYQQLQPRIENGWYQLPGTTDYYGDDGKGSALIGAQAGVGALQDIDSACGPAGKAVYDAAQIADPEIDYSDYDTDKDGVVDFFMMVFPGVGGNGVSQTAAPPYDNIWPHSADLQNQFADADGQKGYVSDDQLRDLEGNLRFWTDESRTHQTTEDTGIPVYVRVGPYNVNPESAIDKASVISHEYGHSLGLPDYYSTGSRATYGTWTLMAEDHSQNIDIVGKKELGWVVPRVLEPGQTRQADGWKDTKVNTHRIDWKTPSGTPYALTGGSVNNGEAYAAELPGRQIIDKVPSGAHAWWSRQGNDFGCSPEAGHNLDIALPGLRDVPAGTPVTLTFKSRWDIEWDFDYGFVMTTTDSGKSYVSHPSAKGYTTDSTQNPNANACQQKYGNGLTGSSGSYEAGTQTVDRVAGNYPSSPFLDDSYDLSDLAGKAAALRFSYATDPGLARPGWFIDDVTVRAGDRVIYSSDFEKTVDPWIFNGGCHDSLQTAQSCTDGWQTVTAGGEDPAEHAYLLEMRDRSGFDATGQGESDRGDPTFAPGVLLSYTDENHGYGNVGTDDPPAQSPLDSQPQPGEEAPDLDDAAFTAAAGDSSFSDAGTGHVDNYTDPRRSDSAWRFDFNCLAFSVKRMTGTDVGLAKNLEGDVTFKSGTGCGRFDFGNGASVGGGGAPVAAAEAKPRTARVGEAVTFDGSGSSDDKDAPEALKYAWQFGDGSGGSGRSVRHAFSSPGAVDVRLTVTDSDGKTGTATVRVTVTGSAAGAGGPAGGIGPSACATVSAFRRVKVSGRRGGGVRFAFARRSGGRAKVDVYRTSTASRVIRSRRVAHFTRKTKSFTWRARGAGDGYYVARLSLKGDTRRVALVRRAGRFRTAGAFARKASCGAIRSFTLERPAFGGTGKAKLAVSFRLARAGTVRLDLLRGGKIVRHLVRSKRRGGRTYRVTLRPKGLHRGRYAVRLKVGRTTARLFTRRL